MHIFKIPLSLALILSLTILIYQFGLHGPYIFDDHVNIVDNPPVLIQQFSTTKLIAAASSFPGSGDRLARPVSMLSFALNHYFTGLDPYWFKLTNLLIHCLNGIMIFFLIRIWLQIIDKCDNVSTWLSRNDWIALATTTAWLVHPINLPSVLYIVQRMSSLATFFCLLGMLLYTVGRLRIMSCKRGGFILIAIGLLGGTTFAFYSKENGALLPLLIFILEWTLFRFATPTRIAQQTLITLYILILAVPLLVAVFFLISDPQWFYSYYSFREFNIEERVLTEFRVLWFYLKQLILPRESDFSLFHDDIVISSGLLSPWTTIISAFGIFGLLGLAFFSKSKQPVLAFGILFFFAGHAMESTILPLELIYEHRNYLPGIGIIFILFYYLLKTQIRLRNLNLGAFFAVVLTISFSYTTIVRSQNWESITQLVFTNLKHHPNSSRWQHEAGRVLFLASTSEEAPQKKEMLENRAIEHINKSAALGSYHKAGHLIALVYLNSATGRVIEQDTIESISNLLSNNIISPFTATSLQNWIECLTKEDCHAPVSLAIRFVDDVIKNPKTDPKLTAYILASAANLTLNNNNPVKALEYSKLATKLNPSHVQHHFNYAYILALLGFTSHAEEELSKARLNDSMGTFNDKLHEIEGMLQQHHNHALENAVPPSE
jgi:protein O-mannosyl-transferase